MRRAPLGKDRARGAEILDLPRFESNPGLTNSVMQNENEVETGKLLLVAHGIGREMGVVIQSPPEDRVARTLRGATHKMSMLQDFERNRPTALSWI